MGVDVVIVNWNGGAEVIAAVRSVQRFGGRPIVVDNASTSGSIDEIAAMPDVTVIRSPTNRGFAAGSNVGVAAGDGEIIMLLNPDAEIVAGAADQLRAAFEATQATLLGVTLTLPSGQPLNSGGPLPSARRLIQELLRVPALGRRLGRQPMPAEPVEAGREGAGTWIGWIVGSALCVRRVDWVRLGGLDEGYFLWFEDMDLAARVARSGGTVALARDIVVVHQGAMSWNRLPRRRRQWLRTVGSYRYARCNIGAGASVAVIAAAPLALVIGIALDAAHLVFDPVRRRRGTKA